jgi:hypothetical protein
MAAESKLEAARRTGSLTNVIGVLREEARTELANASTPAREQVGLEDSAIRVAAGLTGKSDVERRATLREVVPGSTVTAKGVGKTQLSRAEKMAKTIAWAESKTEEWREQFIVSDAFEALTDRQQERISEAFSEIADKAYSDSIGIADYDFDQPSIDVDALTADETAEDEVVDDSDSDFEAMFEQAAWEAEQT